jgi:hypothetical protein
LGILLLRSIHERRQNAALLAGEIKGNLLYRVSRPEHKRQMSLVKQTTTRRQEINEPNSSEEFLALIAEPIQQSLIDSQNVA